MMLAEQNPSDSTKDSTTILLDILQDAGILTSAQIQVARQDRKYFNYLDLEEALILRGWIDSKTVYFFQKKWPEELKQKIKKPLGYYLTESGLLTENDVNEIVQEQNKPNNSLRFGEIAIQKGFLKQKTVDFFIKNLFVNGAKITKTTTVFNEIDCDIIKKYLRGITDFEGSKLSQMKLKGVSLKGVNLKKSEIIAADLREINLAKAILNEANLSKSNLEQAYLRKTQFRYACLQGANLKEADLKEADFSEANLTAANLENAYMIKANLKGANLTRAFLQGAFLYGSYYDKNTVFCEDFDPVKAGMILK
ncbi:MAG: pentapeptide repeat-containing protein [Prochloraceae cyanobacterium]